MIGLLKKIFGDGNEREIKRYMRVVEDINALEPSVAILSDEQLKEKSSDFRTRLERGATLDDILPEAFAVVREASTRVLKMRHFDVQLIGGMVLHDGKIAEMKTGEGKTLVATLATYLNALQGKGVHVVTVNDYLATRDSQIMGELYNFLGLTVGLNLSMMTHDEKQAAYACDITYGTNNEFGFDYLRDNMVLYKEEMVQKPLNFAIIDEVDSILVDEARTPLIISGQAQKSTDWYYAAAKFVTHLVDNEHYVIDLKMNAVSLTEAGVEKAERSFKIDNLYDHHHVQLNHHISNALRANTMMKRDVDYVVQDGEIIIVDEFTGRLMVGRRYSDGLHQSIEAKEGLKVQNESMTLATITFQNYFRMYRKLSGMTGTAKTEEEEFKKIYGLEVVVVPTNRPNVRTDKPDVVYKNIRGKFNAVVSEIIERHKLGQPVLVGTVSIENSELISEMLRRRGVKHEVLNAKQHAREAEIVSLAGQWGAVTIATNMAGRGTDIQLGAGVSDLGGLCILGTERHDSRRIDNQLRGRSGRQGDPGFTQFYLSLEDDLMRRLGSENIMGIMDRLGLEEDQPIESRMITRAIETAQKRAEGSNFDMRKVVLQYDDVMNQQRTIVYKQRKDILEATDLRDIVWNMVEPSVKKAVETHCPPSDVPEDWDLETLAEYLNHTFFNEPVSAKNFQRKESDEIEEWLHEKVLELYAQRCALVGPELLLEFQKVIVLRAVDSKWMDHIDAMDHLRQGIHLRAYGGTDPLREYQFEGYEMFNEMISHIQEEVTLYTMKSEVEQNLERQAVIEGEIHTNSPDIPVNQPKRANDSKVGRNDPCTCGSGKKFKNCCGAVVKV